MDILIESTTKFEKDLSNLSEDKKAEVITKINYYSNLFTTDKSAVYRRLHLFRLSYNLNGYESSLYSLRVMPKLRVILTVDEDPIFAQTIFTLFRVIPASEIERAYKGVAESLYQEFLGKNREVVEMS